MIGWSQINITFGARKKRLSLPMPPSVISDAGIAEVKIAIDQCVMVRKWSIGLETIDFPDHLRPPGCI